MWCDVWLWVCNCGKVRPYSIPESLCRTWSNLSYWNECANIAALPPIGDDFLKLSVSQGKLGPVFHVRSHRGAFADSVDHVGTYVTEKMRKTMDVEELRRLVDISPNGKDLFPHLLQLFPDHALIRTRTMERRFETRGETQD